MYQFFGYKLLRSKLYYIQNDGFYIFMCFCWTIIIPLLMYYVNSLLVHLSLKIVFCQLNCDKMERKNKFVQVKLELSQK